MNVWREIGITGQKMSFLQYGNRKEADVIDF